MDEVLLALPFTGRWRARNSPARRVPSHGTDLMASRYAIDFIGVDDTHRTAHRVDWRTILATEPPTRFVAFGRPILAPSHGTVVAAHDREPDHAARRSPLALIPYALGQPARIRAGTPAIAGNHVIIAIAPGTFVALVHLRQGSLTVAVGDPVTQGQHLGECGNSGNSTQPHLHLQAMDHTDLSVARALPIRFSTFLEMPHATHRSGLPRENSVITPLIGPATTRTATG
ncbi:M23 family metallopeptidase [Catenuloplanes japonicus]|uniref:M23 family metallopeptidase n=1 Tax=Catenuloplanes japonicus TaxID=33876 RepID=UPI000526516B|nr:M23 family metallopeptidase [Catenuloplanes japonicus]